MNLLETSKIQNREVLLKNICQEKYDLFFHIRQF